MKEQPLEVLAQCGPSRERQTPCLTNMYALYEPDAVSRCEAVNDEAGAGTLPKVGDASLPYCVASDKSNGANDSANDAKKVRCPKLNSAELLREVSIN